MRLLLDTHAFYWWLEEPSRLPAETSGFLSSSDTDVLVSVVSIYEIASKARINKLKTAVINVGQLPAVIKKEGFTLLSIRADHALLAGSMEGDLRDPFDRLLAAQAIVEEVPLVSKDRAMRQFGCEILW